jgi:hypothetical protein
MAPTLSRFLSIFTYLTESFGHEKTFVPSGHLGQSVILDEN